MTMKNPPHPGEIIRDLCIKPLGLTVTKAAEGLGITRKTLSLLGHMILPKSANQPIRFMLNHLQGLPTRGRKQLYSLQLAFQKP